MNISFIKAATFHKFQTKFLNHFWWSFTLYNLYVNNWLFNHTNYNISCASQLAQIIVSQSSLIKFLIIYAFPWNTSSNCFSAILYFWKGEISSDLYHHQMIPNIVLKLVGVNIYENIKGQPYFNSWKIWWVILFCLSHPDFGVFLIYKTQTYPYESSYTIYNWIWSYWI